MHQQKRDEQPTDTSVPVDEWMDGLKRSMDQPDLHEWRVWAVTVKIPFQLPQRFQHFGHRWRDKLSLILHVPWPHPVLATTELLGSCVLATHTLQQTCVEFTYSAVPTPTPMPAHN